MATNINAIIKEYKEYQRLANELKEQMELLKKDAIEYLEAEGLDEISTDEGKITYREVISKRLDTTNFKKDYLALYESYVRQSSSMRFTCN